MIDTRKLIFIAMAAVCLSSSASAHHSRSNFNVEEVLEFHGVITEFSWRNPHTFAKLAVTTESGDSKELLLELNSIRVLTRQGWTRDTMSVGDEVTVFANPDRDSNKNLYYSNYFVLPDGQMIASAGGTAPDSVPRAPREQPNTTARSEDFSGIWESSRGNFGARRGGGRGAGMGAGGPDRRTLTLGGQTQAVGLPLTARGQAELDAWDVRDDPKFRCVPDTPPQTFYGAGAHKIIRENDDTIIIRHEVMDVERIVHLGTTEHASGIEPTHLGHSIAWFEAETLVVDTALFAAAKWGIGSGVSSSEQKHLVERFTLIDDGRQLRLDFTFKDPVYMTDPVSMSVTFALNPNYAWQDNYDCDPEASSRHFVE